MVGAKKGRLRKADREREIGLGFGLGEFRFGWRRMEKGVRILGQDVQPVEMSIPVVAMLGRYGLKKYVVTFLAALLTGVFGSFCARRKEVKV